MLNDWIGRVLIMPVYRAALPLHGRWEAGFGDGTREFFWVFAVVLAPSILIASLFAFAAQGLAAAKRPVGVRRVATVGWGLLLFLALSGVFIRLMAPGARAGSVAGEVMTFVTLLLPVRALGVFGFWLPAAVCGVYIVRSRRPRWWAAAAVGSGTLLLGTWFWIVAGMLVGAGLD